MVWLLQFHIPYLSLPVIPAQMKGFLGKFFGSKVPPNPRCFGKPRDTWNVWDSFCVTYPLLVFVSYPKNLIGVS